MIWASLQTGLLNTNYTPAMICGPEDPLLNDSLDCFHSSAMARALCDDHDTAEQTGVLGNDQKLGSRGNRGIHLTTASGRSSRCGVSSSPCDVVFSRRHFCGGSRAATPTSHSRSCRKADYAERRVPPTPSLKSRPESSAEAVMNWSTTVQQLQWPVLAQRPQTPLGVETPALRRPSVMASARSSTPTPTRPSSRAHTPAMIRPRPTSTPRDLLPVIALTRWELDDIEPASSPSPMLCDTPSTIVVPPHTEDTPSYGRLLVPPAAPILLREALPASETLEEVREPEMRTGGLLRRHHSPTLERMLQKSARKLENAKSKSAKVERKADIAILPEASLSASEAKAIQHFYNRQVVPDSVVQSDRQSNYMADELIIGARELSGHERERIGTVFRQLNPSMGNVLWSTLAQRLSERLTPVHVQRIGAYFQFPARFRIGGYQERVSLLISCTQEKRARICFGILDVDCDGCIGARDVFATFQSASKLSGDPLQAQNNVGGKSYSVTFMMRQPLGIEVSMSPSSRMVVSMVVPGGLADQRGLQRGDWVLQANGFDVETLELEEIQTLIREQVRPLHLVMFRGTLEMPVFSPLDFDRLLRGLRERMTSRVWMTLISVRSLRSDAGTHGIPDVYCTCEILGKAGAKVQTKAASDNLEPVWNEDKVISSYMVGDNLRFTVRYRNSTSRSDELLGRAVLPGARLVVGMDAADVGAEVGDSRDLEAKRSHSVCADSSVDGTERGGEGGGGFDGELDLLDNCGVVAGTLRLKAQVMGEGGISFNDFMELHGSNDFAFYESIAQVLTGGSPATAASRGRGAGAA
eukprot:TRINITY_DN27021_c0_g4_i1.p1 TRINITY_DN27021_c0_g4~~TRINITY_DN27021_c0_g4_i1.p1  ORF type:complete len:811 (+),score=118.92 TRINITY_DN27021_c0_g4_i1:167-2599(+)